MWSRLKDFFKTLEEDRLEGKLSRHDHFEALSRIDDALIRMHQEMKFSGGVIYRLLLRELDHNGPTYEMHFLLGNHVVKFSNVKFSLITKVRFGVVPDTRLYTAVEKDIHQRYFPEANEVLLEELRVVLTLGEFQEVYDGVKFCLMYMLDRILMGMDERFKIPV
ncbi:hypothetical protein Ddye_028865 [Dipteronia dyeriana]|uniref:Uncharacterized protein n=1 Tax=Dipteronia dyeriana TaxID=168575 RepID=A0AAD9TEJ8_9ROSI|nr:hypothetical protein Ddye_028865 [Dipteronia dyeriana]